MQTAFKGRECRGKEVSGLPVSKWYPTGCRISKVVDGIGDGRELYGVCTYHIVILNHYRQHAMGKPGIERYEKDGNTCSELLSAAIHMSQSVFVYGCLSSRGIPYCRENIRIIWYWQVSHLDILAGEHNRFKKNRQQCYSGVKTFWLSLNNFVTYTRSMLLLAKVTIVWPSLSDATLI